MTCVPAVLRSRATHSSVPARGCVLIENVVQLVILRSHAEHSIKIVIVSCHSFVSFMNRDSDEDEDDAAKNGLFKVAPRALHSSQLSVAEDRSRRDDGGRPLLLLERGSSARTHPGGGRRRKFKQHSGPHTPRQG